MNAPLALEEVKDYYTEKLALHGPTSKGVDWTSAESQTLRFEQLEKLIAPGARFSILDYGCGFGSLHVFLSGRHKAFEYVGFDIAEKMLEAAARLHTGPNASWVRRPEELSSVDYTLASGVFNVRLKHGDSEWERHIQDTLQLFHRLSRKGFAFNLLTSYSDKERRKDYLYYAEPSFWFDYCKRNFSKYVSLLHDYPLYEFTLLVWRAA